METPEIILALLFAVSVLALLAQRLKLSAPIVFVLGGLGIGFIPDIPIITIPPDWMMLIFLPPLLMESAYFTSLRDFKFNLRPILQLAIGLVVMTTVAVAFTVMAVSPEIGLALGFILGAIISPPDAVAASAVIKTMNVPKRIVAILEGESLVNDATGLVLYGFAVAAVVSGVFSPSVAVLEFVWMVTSGIVIGVALAWIYMKLFPRIQDTAIEILSTILLPYGIYILAHGVHSSGVIAIVAAGLTVGWLQPEVFTSRFRIPAESVWKMLTFLLNGVVFLLIGLQLPFIWNSLKGYDASELLLLSSAVCFVAILVRFIWVFALAYGWRFLFSSIRKNDPYPAWQNVMVVAWTGMRGVVSLATALAIPLTLADGSEFPHRDLLIFLSVVVIIFTLLAQGLTLPLLTRKLKLKYNNTLLHEDWNARVTAAREAMLVLENLKLSDDVHAPALNRIISHYEDRLESLGDGPNTPLTASEIPQAHAHPILQAENRIWDKVIEAEHRAILELRKNFQISDDVMHDIVREMDLLSARFKLHTH